jgi:cardiolipin synthase
MASRSLIVLPDDTPAQIIAAIAGATTSLRVKMFIFSDPAMLAATIAAKQRGVDVRVMLNPARRNGEEENAETRVALIAGGVDVADSNPAFVLTHEKSMVVDSATAYVKSLNWDRQPFDAGDSAKLIWCPGNGRERISRFIDAARDTLFVQNERYQDTIVIERLVRAARRGVKVHVMVRPPHTLKIDKLMEGVGGLRILDDVGVKVHKLKHLKLHGKMFLADGTCGIVGSINLAPGSLDGRRELAIEMHDKPVIERLHEIARHDWKNSSRIDLSDAGLLADLGDDTAATELLVLDDHKR